MGKVAVVGSTNIDLAMRLRRWPKVGETVFGETLQRAVGGKGANQAVAAARLGAEVIFVSGIGTDNFGEIAEERFREEQLSILLLRVETHTGTALIDIGPDGGNIIKLAPGANAELPVDFVRSNRDALNGCSVLLLQNEIPLEVSLEAASIARRSGCTVVMDPAPAPEPLWEDDIYRNFDVITPNATEAGAILRAEVHTQKQGLWAAEMLSHRFGLSVVVTLGALGAAWCHQGRVGHKPCPEVEAIDTVAAGDCFNGAFAASLAESESFEVSVDFALKAAAIATTRRGAIDSLPSCRDLQKFENHRKGA